MIFIWRGWGPLALVALFLPLASCAGLMDTRPALAMLAGGLTLAAGGAACWVLGRRWNRAGAEHSLYFVPLQYWAVPYVLFGALAIVGGAAGLLRGRP